MQPQGLRVALAEPREPRREDMHERALPAGEDEWTRRVAVHRRPQSPLAGEHLERVRPQRLAGGRRHQGPPGPGVKGRADRVREALDDREEGRLRLAHPGRGVGERPGVAERHESAQVVRVHGGSTGIETNDS